jgi:hypothetical protein
VGQLNNYQPAAGAFFVCKSDLSESEIGLEHEKWLNLHGAHLQKRLQTALIFFLSLSSDLMEDAGILTLTLLTLT